MGKEFLKLKADERKSYAVILLVGLGITIALGINTWQERKLTNGYELLKNDQEEGDYEEHLIARVGEEKIPLTVLVKERALTEKEAKEQLLKAREMLPAYLMGENESLKNVTTDLNFITRVPDTYVEVQWVERGSEFFSYDGEIKEDLELLEMVELKVSAILSCQGISEDYETTITLMPKSLKVSEALLNQIEKQQEEKPENEVLILPDTYEGKTVTWKKVPDYTFLWIFVLTVLSVLLLKLGQKRDVEEEKKKRLERLEREYAQIVSKFTMLLSAGLSVRNAWERIVLLYRRKEDTQNIVFQELNWGLMQMQKGVPELEVYEVFGIRTGLVHYKKMMAIFISDRKRGSVNLLDAMNQEMLLAWEEKKRKTRQHGEKIGTKLLIPMMGMLGIVFVIILVPAFLSFEL